MRRWVKGVLAGVVTASFGAILGLTPRGAGFEQEVGLGWLFKLRGTLTPPPEAAVIAIDDQTGGQLGLSKLPREWPRSVHARLIDKLTQLGASVIVFDFDFQIPKSAEDDLIFARAIEKADRVVLAEKLVGKRQMVLDPNGRQSGSVWVEQLVLPIPPLVNAARGLGSFPLPKVQVAVHDFWAFKPSVGDAPTMPAAALQVHALKAYPRFLAFLREMGVVGSEGLPGAPEDLGHAAELRKLMAQLRRIFQNDSGLGPRLRKALDHQSEKAMDPRQRRLLAALVNLYEGGDHRYLNFYGPPGTIPTIPYHAVLTNAAQPIDLTDKVVFVGYSDLYDPGQPDRFYTVFTNSDGVDLSGVEIAATAFANLLTDRSLRSYEPLATAGILAATGGLLGAMVYLLPAIVGVPLALTLSGAYALAAHLAFVRTDTYLPLAVPLLVQLPLALFIGLVSQYLLERHKKKQATRAISYYLPESVVRDFTDKVLDPSAINKVAYSTCLASDMAGFTAISEQLRPKELAVFLNDYFDTLSQPLRRHHVDVVEFRADGIMCAWTSEQPEVTVRRRAIQAALEAVAAVAQFKERHALLSQSLRIGLEVGMVYVGHAGGGGHFVYSIVGDCANTAARVEGLNKQLGTQLLATRSVVEGVANLVLRPVGDFRFVGKTEPLPILEILAMKDTADDSQVLLCEMFGEAMDILRAGEWAEAVDSFAAILGRYPDDGPSRFHLARCQRYLREGILPELPWVVHLDSK